MSKKQTETEPKTTTAEVTPQDLKLILNVIEIASSRGSFKAAELSTVGYINDKIAQIVKQHGA